MAMESGDRNLQLVARGATIEELSMLQKFVAEEMESLLKGCQKKSTLVKSPANLKQYLAKMDEIEL